MTTVDAERSERLRSVDLTSSLDRVALARLAAYMDPVSVVPGQVICAEGDAGDALYIATHGRLYSHAQARRMAFAYDALALSLPYRHLLGLL